VFLNKSIYIPVTPFHLVCATILKNNFKNTSNILIIINDLFDDFLIEKIQKSENWSSVIIIRKTGKRFTSFQRSSYFDELMFLKTYVNFNVFYFTPGVSVSNFIINILSKNNQVYLCDDGIAPYYFNHQILQKWHDLVNGFSIRNIFLKLVRFLTSRNFQFEIHNIDNLLLMNYELSNLISDNHFVIKIHNSNKEISLMEVSEYYIDFMPSVYDDFKVVYFHSGNVKIDIQIYQRLLQKYRPNEIFICFRQGASFEPFSNFNIYNNNNIPWEIIHFYFAGNFKDSVLICTNFTTAFINTINPLIGNHFRYIINNDFFYEMDKYHKNHKFKEIQNIMNKHSLFPIIVLNSIEELL